MNIQSRIDEGRKVVEELLSMRPLPFNDTAKEMIPRKHGIYAIINSSTGEFIYAGKSQQGKEGLQNRIWIQHRTGDAGSDLAQMLVNSDDMSVHSRAEGRQWMKEHLAVYYLTEDQFCIDINSAEHFTIAVLNPKYNK